MLMSYWKVLLVHALASSILGHATLSLSLGGTDLLRFTVVNQIWDPVEWWLRFLLLRRVSRIGSSCVSAAITVHPFVPKPDWCIFRLALVFLQILPQWHRVSVIFPSNVIWSYPFHSPVCFQLSILLSFLSFSSLRRFQGCYSLLRSVTVSVHLSPVYCLASVTSQSSLVAIPSVLAVNNCPYERRNLQMMIPC